MTDPDRYKTHDTTAGQSPIASNEQTAGLISAFIFLNLATMDGAEKALPFVARK